jgi:hypothetical protein
MFGETLSLADFLLITLSMGGGIAWLSGRAIASTWRPYWHVVAYMIVWAAVVRWLHYALFGGTLLSLSLYGLDLVVVLFFSLLSFVVMRNQQMKTQYGWLKRDISLLKGNPKTF